MADTLEIHDARSPVGGVNSGVDMMMKTAVWPFSWRIDVTMLDRVVMDVFDMPAKILFVAQEVFPVSMLP